MSEIFNSVTEAKATLEESGVLAQNLSRAANGSFHIEGYFTPKDLEAILYLYRNNDPMVFPEKDKNGKPDGVLRPRKSFMELLGFTEASCPEAVATALRNVRVALDEHYENTPNPSIQYLPGPSSDLLNRKTFMELLGVTPESTGDEIASKLRAVRLALEAVGSPKDKLLDFRSETTFPAMDTPAYKLTDMHGARGAAIPISDEYDKGIVGLAGLLPGNFSSAPALLPTGNDTLNRMLREGGGLRRGEWPGEVASRTGINRSAITGGTVTHSFEEGDDDYPMLTELLNKLNNFETSFPGLKLGEMRFEVSAPWAAGGQLCFQKDDGFFTLVLDKGIGVDKLGSFKLADNGIVVVFEHNSAVVGYSSLVYIFEAFNDISPEKVKAVVAAIKAEHGE